MVKTSLSAGFVLPILDPGGAIALARTLETTAAACAGQLAPHVLNNLDAVREDREALEHELGLVAVTPGEVKVVDHEEDTCIRAFHGILGAWALLEEQIPEAILATTLRDHLFPDGIAFINAPVKKEWAIVESKLRSIAENKLEPSLLQLGLAPLLAHLRAVHQRYGEVTGTTKQTEQIDSPGVRASLGNLIGSIRHYGAAVVGSVERRKPETAALAETLLEPITSWRASQKTKKAKGPTTPEAPTAPGTPTTPGAPAAPPGPTTKG